MYNYRKLTPEQKAEVLNDRIFKGYPLHEPPHLHKVEGWFLITSATYEHQPHFHSEEHKLWLIEELFRELNIAGITCNGWVVLPNHYHIHYNPTKHGYVEKPLDWTCSSVHWYLEHFGIEWLRDSWRQHPIRDYGKGWDWEND